MDNGWISLHRKLSKHWIWNNDKYLKCWIWFLFRANHKSKKIVIGSELIKLKRGEFVTSIQKISEASGLTFQSTRTFLTLLQKDEIINKQTTNKLTKITLCKYVIYQDDQQTKKMKSTNKQQTNNKQTTTDNKDNNVNNKYIYNKFYDNEILKSDNNNQYIKFVKFLFGENAYKIKLDKLLKLETQVTFDNFNNLIELSVKNKKDIKKIILEFDNYLENPKRKYKNVYKTLATWIKRD